MPGDINNGTSNFTKLLVDITGAVARGDAGLYSSSVFYYMAGDRSGTSSHMIFLKGCLMLCKYVKY